MAFNYWPKWQTSKWQVWAHAKFEIWGDYYRIASLSNSNNIGAPRTPQSSLQPATPTWIKYVILYTFSQTYVKNTHVYLERLLVRAQTTICIYKLGSAKNRDFDYLQADTICRFLQCVVWSAGANLLFTSFYTYFRVSWGWVANSF